MQDHRWSARCPAPRDLVRPVPLDSEGRRGPTADHAKGSRWRRTSRGLYLPSAVDGSRPEQRVLEQAARCHRQAR